MIRDYLAQLIAMLSNDTSPAPWLQVSVNTALLIALAIIAYYISKLLLSGLFNVMTKATKRDLKSPLVRHNILQKCARFGSLMVLISAVKIMSAEDAVGDDILVLGIQIFSIFVFLQIAFGVLNVFSDVYSKLTIAKDVPINGFLQLTKLFIVIISFIFLISFVTHKSPVYLLSSLGAITAIIMLVFKDTILGFVGGIQIIANRLISVGDWIEMPTYNADGEVLEIGLNIITVQNWDKTISSIPTYSVMSSSFKNWKGMAKSGSRRIKRGFAIDQNTISAVDEAQIAAYKEKLPLLKNCDTSLATSNVSLYRRYMEAWLKQHPKINTRFTLLVRELDPTPTGLPVEFYCFSNDNAWRNYEEIQADIMNYAMISLDLFELKGFQNASGDDVQQGLKNLSEHH